MAALNKNTSKFEDIISKSVRLHPGPPAVYQLTPKTDKIGTLTRFTVGERTVTRANKTILFVGETGAGKSTLINALLNYTFGVKWEDEAWFQIVKDEKTSETESQTSDVVVYEMFGLEDNALPYSLTVIDTPGFGSTQGYECDVLISQRLLDLFRSEDGVHEVNAVGLVMKASDNRLSDRLMYIFNSVVSLFGKDLEENIVTLITHSDGMSPDNALEALRAATVKCAQNEENQPVHFLFNNRQNNPRKQRYTGALKGSWDLTNEEMSLFAAFLEKTAPQKLEKTVDVLNSHVRLAAHIHNLQDRIWLTELKQKEIQQTQEALRKHEEEMKKNKNFTFEVNEVYMDKKRLDEWWWWRWYGAVCCTVCKENCHYPGCTLASKPESCEVMSKGRCTVCSMKCPASDHVKERWIYVAKTRKVKKTEAEIKQRYDMNKTGAACQSSLLESLEKQMDQLTSEKKQLVEESYGYVVKLEKIALKFDSLSTYVHLDSLIDIMEKGGDGEKVQKLKGMRSQMGGAISRVLQCGWGKAKAPWKQLESDQSK